MLQCPLAAGLRNRAVTNPEYVPKELNIFSFVSGVKTKTLSTGQRNQLCELHNGFELGPRDGAGPVTRSKKTSGNGHHIFGISSPSSACKDEFSGALSFTCTSRDISRFQHTITTSPCQVTQT